MAQKFLTHIDLNQNELQNAVVQNLGTAPGSPVAGQVYFDTNGGINHIKVYNGSGWDDLTEGDISAVVAGTGLAGGGTSGSVTLNIDDTGVTATSYGSSTSIPVITVNAQGQITSASTASISTILNIAADSGTDDGVALATDELTIAGGTGISTSVSGDTITVTNDGVVSLTGTANEVEVSAASGSVTIGLPNDVTIGNNLTITGDLTVNGTTTTVNSTTVTVDDPIFTLGGDGSGVDDSKDRGIEFKWNDGVDPKVGFFGYDESNGFFTFIPDATNTSEVFSGSQGIVSVNEYYVGASSVLSSTTLGSSVVNSSLTSVGTIATGTWEATDVAVAHGGTGASTEANARTNLGVSTGSPTTSTSVLARIAAQDCAASSGSTSVTTVTHNFGTKDNVVQVFDTSSGATVIGDVVRTDTNTVTVTLNGASISAGDYRIVVTSA